MSRLLMASTTTRSLLARAVAERLVFRMTIVRGR
jgi:hypothetical protein